MQSWPDRKKKQKICQAPPVPSLYIYTWLVQWISCYIIQHIHSLIRNPNFIIAVGTLLRSGTLSWGGGSLWVGLSPWVGPCPGVGAQFPTVAVCAVLFKYNHNYSNDNNKDTNITANIVNIVMQLFYMNLLRKQGYQTRLKTGSHLLQNIRISTFLLWFNM